MKRALALVMVLAAGLACERMYHPGSQSKIDTWKKGPVYAPWQEGLTLVYENPTLPPEQRLDKRLQLRVSKLQPSGDSALVTQTYTTMQSPPLEVQAFLKDGGVSLVEGAKHLVMLPEGFPDRVRIWETRNVRYSCLGRAAADLHGLRLPDTVDPVGVWVEASPIVGQGKRMRVFYLDGIGEVETLLWQDDRWVSVNRLVSRGFTDAPPAPSH